ncbi:P-loop containing nucleoside triphosphate hydrolase protein [Chytridium lagenaria]|nr:P-loop containing nucleoside triphosphate hydrolase protein [Chytridium lagenaria]
MGPKGKGKGSSSSSAASSSTSGKDDKKGAKKDEKPAMFVPEPGQKLTREQHAILRAQRAQAAAEEKRQLFGSWTGKTPLMVLYDQCQKMEWDKAQVNVGKKSKGYQGSVIISRDDKKTREKIKFTYCDDTKFYLTDLEAKQLTRHKWAATYALHRFSSHLSLHRLLPPNHQDYWAQLEIIRKASSPDTQQFEYAPDPFAALELRAKLAIEKEKAEKEAKERLEKEKEKQAKPWEEYQEVRLGKEMEHEVDDVLRRLEEVERIAGSGKDDVEMKSGGTGDRDEIITSLEKLGFLKSHAEEATEYVPEDDLPPTFTPKQEVKMISSVSTSHIDSQTREKSLKRLLLTGFGRRICEQALRLSNNSVSLALSLLSRKLSGVPSEVQFDATQPSDNAAIEDEVMALEAIFGPRAIVEQGSEGETFLRVSMETNPDVAIECDSTALRVEAALRGGGNEVGQSMVFDLVEFLEERLEEVLGTPEKLRGLAVFGLLESGKEEVVEETARVVKEAKGAQRKREKRRGDEEAIQARLVKIEESSLFKEMLKMRSRLPSFAYREKIVEAMGSSSVLILCGETGCGKSTQTGQFILENEVKSGKGGICNIICTQPRRISAISVAERVAAERGEQVGESIGYTVRGETKKSSFTRMTFLHYWSPAAHGANDFLLVILKDLLNRRSDLKLILMSATINSDTFSAYFSQAPVLNIPGFTHPVTDYYLEDIFLSVKYTPDIRGKRSTKVPDEDEERTQRYNAMGIEPRAVKYLLREGIHEPIDNGFIAAVVRHICDTTDDGGAILIFLQGALEIDRCLQTLQNECSDLKLDLYPLHASLSAKQQSAVFRRAKKGYRKVVAATNVAETSITIDDVVFVIDCGRVKEMRYEGTVMALTETLASAASCRQRRGRAGRVRPGFCYKLFSKHLESTIMPPQTVPEILRVPLEQLCLTLKAMGVDDATAFLMRNIKMALDDLKSLSALEESTEKLTCLGQHLAAIPADVRVAKMLIFGAIFHCLDPILTIAALMSTKSPFVAGGTRREEARIARKAFAWDRSDWLTDCRAYDAWAEAKRSGKAAEMDFCDKKTISGYPGRSWVSWSVAGGGERWNENKGNSRLIKAALVAGLYPRVVVVRHPDTRYVETSYGAMPKEAEAQQIKFFEPGESKVFIHPASVNFDATKFEDLLLVYHQKVSTSKVFIRDSTMVSPWPILMLGGKLTVDHTGRTVEVDGFTKFQAFPRIAVLVNGLRRALDRELGRKVDEPAFDISASPVGKCLITLIKGDGQ